MPSSSPSQPPSREQGARAPGSFFLRTLGCKTNQYEGEGMRELLRACGLVEAAGAGQADLCVVNTCGVTGRAAAASRSALRAMRRRNPTARLVVTGCSVDLQEDWVRELPDEVLRVPNSGKHALAQMLGLAPGTANTGTGSIAGAAAPRFGFRLRGHGTRTRAWVKIQDGCDHACTYCIIPRARGKPVSRPAAEVLAEARALLSVGHRELVLTGINIGAYRDANDMDLASLVQALDRLPGLARLRLGSVEPELLTSRLLYALRDCEHACPHLHLPLQSGSDRVLAAMGRRYTTADFARAVEQARKLLDTPGITTDVIVGFPAEGESEFRQSLEFCRRLGFSRAHVFTFSPRPGTPAARLPRCAPQRLVTRRHASMVAAMDASAAAFAAGFAGRRVRVIAEEHADGRLRGYTDRYLRASFPGPPTLVGSVLALSVGAVRGSELLAVSPGSARP